jgi:hypothetical protein
MQGIHLFPEVIRFPADLVFREIFLLLGSVPIEIILSLIFLYDLLGWSSLVGVALMMATMVVPILMAKTLAGIQRRFKEATDARIGLMVGFSEWRFIGLLLTINRQRFWAP